MSNLSRAISGLKVTPRERRVSRNFKESASEVQKYVTPRERRVSRNMHSSVSTNLENLSRLARGV